MSTELLALYGVPKQKVLSKSYRGLNYYVKDLLASPDTHPHLVLETARGKKRIPLVDATAWTIGRGRENAIQLADQCASRNHAMLQMVGPGSYFLVDLGSRNGSFINGRRVSIPLNLKNGDRITLGETNIEFICPDTTDALEEPTVDPESTDTMMLHKRRLITVLVIDIRNFTRLTQQLDEQILSEVIGTWFRRAGEIISEHGSWVDKYIGDAVMSVWIHSTVPGTDRVPMPEMLRPFHALHDLANMSSSLNEQFPLPFRLRIGAGMNTGFAMVGQMGSSNHADYTALGDTVNAAFRLESATKEIGLDVALGEATYSRTPNTTDLPFKQHQVNLKGYDEPTLTYAGTFDELGQFLSKIEQ